MAEAGAQVAGVVTPAQFRSREACIGCGSSRLRTVFRGRFGEEPHLSIIGGSPWGESPLPYLTDSEWELVCCDDCGVGFHKHVLTEEWERRRFAQWMSGDAIARFEEEHGLNEPMGILGHARHDLERLLCIEKMTRELRGADAPGVLDFGCGWGRVVALANLLGFEAYGVDRSTARLEKSFAPGRIFPTLEDYRAKVGKKLHAITLFEVLEHLFAPAEIVRALAAELLPGGILVVEVPDCGDLQRPDKQRLLLAADGIDHINAFTPAALTALVEAAGFERVRPPTAQVSADWLAVAKREVRRYVRRFRDASTQQFFRKI